MEISNILDSGLASKGMGQIEWAREFMPALRDTKREVKSLGHLAGKRVGIVLTLEPTTGALAIAITETGADVSVYCTAPQTSDAVAAALTSRGINVYARSDADREMEKVLLDRFLDDDIEYLIDDGAYVTRYIHTERSDALDVLVGVTEETTSGVSPLRVMESEGSLKVPCIAANDARAKQYFDNVYGTGQSVIMTLLDVTNIQLQGKTCVVVGYGQVGSGIARYANALGARVVVTEIDPIKAMKAIHDGHRVAKLEDACRYGDIFLTATGVGYTLTGDHMRLMKDGAIISVGGAGPPEVDLGGVEPVHGAALARPEVRTIPISDGSSVFLIADGECSNVTAGEGNAIEIMDLTFAVQLLSLEYLVKNEGILSNSVHLLPSEIDNRVAGSMLNSVGAGLDEPSQAQIDHSNSW